MSKKVFPPGCTPEHMAKSWLIEVLNDIVDLMYKNCHNEWCTEPPTGEDVSLSLQVILEDNGLAPTLKEVNDL
jgi:hypothetical protein